MSACMFRRRLGAQREDRGLPLSQAEEVHRSLHPLRVCMCSVDAAEQKWWCCLAAQEWQWWRWWRWCHWWASGVGFVVTVRVKRAAHYHCQRLKTSDRFHRSWTPPCVTEVFKMWKYVLSVIARGAIIAKFEKHFFDYKSTACHYIRNAGQERVSPKQQLQVK